MLKRLQIKMGNLWSVSIDSYFKDDAKVWWHSLDYAKRKALFTEDLEQILLYKWSHAKNKDQVG